MNFQFKVIETCDASPEDLQIHLNELGSEGWSVVASTVLKYTSIDPGDGGGDLQAGGPALILQREYRITQEPKAFERGPLGAIGYGGDE